jgi:hypothetical protein
MFTLVRITVDFTPADVDVSLKDFRPVPFDFSTLSHIRFFIPLLHFARWMEKKFPEKQKSSQIFIV